VHKSDARLSGDATRDVEAEAVKFLWKQKWKHFEERSWKRKQTRNRLTLYGAGSGSKKYSTASTSMDVTHLSVSRKILRLDINKN